MSDERAIRDAAEELHDLLADGKRRAIDLENTAMAKLQVMARLLSCHKVLASETVLICSPPQKGKILLEVDHTGSLDAHEVRLNELVIEQCEFVGWSDAGKTTVNINRQCMGIHALKIHDGTPAFVFRDCTFEGFETTEVVDERASAPSVQPIESNDKVPSPQDRNTYYAYSAGEAYLIEKHDVSKPKQAEIYSVLKAALDNEIDREESGISSDYELQDTLKAFLEAYRRFRRKIKS